MAMIKCPECGKEISSLAVSCPNCGRPMQSQKESHTIDSSNNVTENDSGSDIKSGSMLQDFFKLKFKSIRNISEILNDKKKVTIAIIVACVILVVIIGVSINNYKIKAEKYDTAILYENMGEYDEAIKIYKDLGNYKDSDICSDYCKALSLCAEGNYESAYSILMNIKDYEKTTTLLKQIYYETRLFEGVNELKLYMKNPDSLTLKKVSFYYSKSTTTGSTATIENPACVILKSGQNGFGGYSSSYSLCTYNKSEDSYQYAGSCNSLNASDYDLSDKEEIYMWLVCKAINLHKNNIEIVDAVDMNRVCAIITSGKYAQIKRIPVQSVEDFSTYIENEVENKSSTENQSS